MKILSEKRVAYIFTGVVLLSSIILSATSIYGKAQEQKLKNAKIDVLKDWSVTVDASKSYMPGDVVQVTSKFTKLVNVKGDPERFIQCHKLNSKDWDGLVLSNKGTGTSQPIVNGVSTYGVGIPLNVGVLPNTCRICPIISYNVDKYHPNFQEKTCSNEFKIEPRPGIVTNDDTTYIYSTNGAQQTPGIDSQSSAIQDPGNQPIVIYQSSPKNNNSEDSQATVPQRNLIDDLGGAVQQILHVIGL